MKITIERIALFVLLGALLFQSRSQPAPQYGTVYASFGSQQIRTIALAPGDQLTVTCATRLVPVRVGVRETVMRCAPQDATALPSATPSATSPSEPTASPTMPHDTSTPPPPSGSMQAWHAPGAHDGLNAHEHGDAPPQWANDFSIANFGHPVIFGGDERSSDIENTHKHQAFKGVAYRVNGGSSCAVDLYFRYHAASNPMDRASAFHSFEIYMKDCQGGVSFRQGVYWVGYPEFRSQRMNRFNELRGTPLLDGSNLPAPGRDQFIIGAPDRNDWFGQNGAPQNRCEQWYAFAGKHGGEYSITICGVTARFSYDEHLGPVHDMGTWDLTGGLGLGRRFEVTLYGPNSPAPTVQPAGWFCASKDPIQDRVEGRTHRPKWNLLTGRTSPDCPAEYLPQYTAPTFPNTGINFSIGNTLPTKNFPGAGIVDVPN